MSTRRLFLSTVTHEFKSCRVQLAQDLRLPDVIVQNQEEYVAKIAAGESLLIKLDDYIRDCDAVIHLIGLQTSEQGEPAKQACVDDLLRRYADFSARTGLTDVELRALSYTQWEAWLAYYHKQTTRPALKLFLATPVAGFIPDHPPHAATAAAQAQSQDWHAQRLRDRGYYPEIRFENADRLAVEVLRALKDILPARQPAQRIADSRLVTRHTTDALLGREAELDLLDQAWARDSTHIQCVIAWGGVGKTALLAHWVQTRFRDLGWKNADGQPEPHDYFDWTFYDQGVRASDATHAGAASVGSFFSEALRHFGDAEPDQPERKAERLAALVQTHRSLIVLDGLEPLQYPHNHPQAGQLTDPDLARFLRLLAQKNPGLCLISSREALSELGGHLRASVPHHDLDDLTTPAAIALLRQQHVIGSDDDLTRAAEDYQHHALSLILLGRFLYTARGGDIRRRDTVSFEKLDSKRDAQTRSAWRVLQSYEHWLASPAGNPADLQALRLLGLFDRPATPDCLGALRRAPAIAGITDRLQALDDDDWNAALHRLHAAHLIQLRVPSRTPGSQAPHHEPRMLPVDAHPLVREYFARQLRGNEPQGYQAAHARLFEHLCQTTEPHQPDTLDGLQPLYQAVVHGCLAGRQRQACEEVYYDRILRGTGAGGAGGHYSIRRLGAVGADLGAVTAFFEMPWIRPSSKLNESVQSWLLSEAAVRLRFLGRLAEALEPMRAGLKMDIKAEHWHNSAVSASNISELEVALAEFEPAIADARRAISYADRIDAPGWSQRMFSRTTAADALHQWGKPRDAGVTKPAERAEMDAVTEARQLFEQAETLQREFQPRFELLYALQGFRYCD
nr:ATP-binding protein [Xanthomonadales bacterium]